MTFLLDVKLERKFDNLYVYKWILKQYYEFSKSSAVAEMGDCLATDRPKSGGCGVLSLFFGGGGPHL